MVRFSGHPITVTVAFFKMYWEGHMLFLVMLTSLVAAQFDGH